MLDAADSLNPFHRPLLPWVGPMLLPDVRSYARADSRGGLVSHRSLVVA